MCRKQFPYSFDTKCRIEHVYSFLLFQLGDRNMEFDIDLSDVKDEDIENANSFEPIPAGRYTLKAEEWEVKTSKNANQYIAVTFSVVSEGYKTRKIWQNYAVGAAQGKFARALVKAWALATGENISSINKDSMNALLERPFDAMVGIEESEGYKPKNKIEQFIMPESGTLAKNKLDLSVDELKEDDRDEGVPF